jgi:septal ring factor EnvC (AmiA/AmiB activator)
MRLVMIVLVLAACGEVRQSHRWPDHRQEKDAQIASLVQETQAITQQAAVLEARIKRLEQELAKLQQAAQPALPSPGT